ncbi:glycine betaine ABC transporter substrate-binding protein [Bacillus gobiensis]|uniref:glycine betaine ABC transporter substrate-binding protein n=1 Tax=Bacillus gobiensis TaxID=1441095 RepID=UPI003D21915B
MTSLLGSEIYNKPVLRVGNISLSFHQASAAVVQRIIERFGYDVETKQAPHEMMFKIHEKGDVDFLVSAWLPSSHEVYLNRYLEDIEQLGVLYEPYCIWGVPDYVPIGMVDSVEDLLKPEVADRMTKLIQGIGAGAGISRFSRQMIQVYGLDQRGYYFENGTEEECFAAFDQAIDKGKWAIVPLWHPQFLHEMYPIRELKEPKGLLGIQDQATLIVRKETLPLVSENLIQVLRDLYLGNAAVTQMDYYINKKGMSPLEAADTWMEENQEKTLKWFSRL